MTSMETPRLLSEYVAARAQSERSISARTDVVVASRRRSAVSRRPRLVSGERRLPACSIRQLAECTWQRKHGKRCEAVRGKLPRTTGQRPVLPGSKTRTSARICRFRGVGYRSFGRIRPRDRQIAFPQFFDVWQFLEIAQPKVIEEELCRFIEKRAPGDFCASTDFHQAALHQCLQYAVDVHA